MSSATQAIASSLALTPGRWAMDPNHSAITFSSRLLGLRKVRGRFRVFDVSLDVGPSGTEFEVEASIDLASIDTSLPRRDAHLRTADFFHVDEHPTMTFRSARIEPVGGGYTMSGDLTLKGLTRAVTLEVQSNPTVWRLRSMVPLALDSAPRASCAEVTSTSASSRSASIAWFWLTKSNSSWTCNSCGRQ